MKLSRALSSVRRVPLQRRKDRILAGDLSKGDEILVATGGYSRLARIEKRNGVVTITTESGEKARMAVTTVVGVRR